MSRRESAIDFYHNHTGELAAVSLLGAVGAAVGVGFWLHSSEETEWRLRDERIAGVVDEAAQDDFTVFEVDRPYDINGNTPTYNNGKEAIYTLRIDLGTCGLGAYVTAINGKDEIPTDITDYNISIRGVDRTVHNAEELRDLFVDDDPCGGVLSPTSNSAEATLGQ